MKRIENGNRTNILVGMMILLLILLLVSDWTNLLGNLRNITMTRGINSWFKVLSYFPIIWIVQIFSLKVEKLYGVGVAFYFFFFLLNGYVLFNRITDYYLIFNYDRLILNHLIIKIFEQFLLSVILYLTVKITINQKSNNTFNNNPKEIL